MKTILFRLMPLAVILMMLNSCYYGFGYRIGEKDFDESQVTLKYQYPMPDYSSYLDCNGYYAIIQPNKKGNLVVSDRSEYYVFYPDGTMALVEQNTTKEKTQKIQFTGPNTGVYEVKGDTINYEFFSPGHPKFGSPWTMIRGQAIIINHHHLRIVSLSHIEANREVEVPYIADLRFVMCDALPEPDVFLKHRRWMWRSASEKRQYYKSINK